MFERKGFCTETSFNKNGLICLQCKNKVTHLHQPMRYNEFKVCYDCFDDVKRAFNGNTKIILSNEVLEEIANYKKIDI